MAARNPTTPILLKLPLCLDEVTITPIHSVYKSTQRKAQFTPFVSSPMQKTVAVAIHSEQCEARRGERHISPFPPFLRVFPRLASSGQHKPAL